MGSGSGDVARRHRTHVRCRPCCQSRRRIARTPRSEHEVTQTVDRDGPAPDVKHAPRYPAAMNRGRSNNMKANRRTNTKPEIRLRSALHRLGYRFRKDMPVRAGEVRVRPDIVFSRQRVAIFVDGCFWHCCPEHGRIPGVNGWYWDPKLKRNVERDREVTAALTRHGWTVIRLWEHEPLDTAVDQVVARLIKA